MKRLFLLLFSFISVYSAFSQSSSLLDGNNCFSKGDYSCAILKYKEAISFSDPKQKKIAADNLRQAEKCFELLRMADLAFNGKNYIKAKELYKNIINENSKDEYAKAQLDELKALLMTLSVSKNVVLFSKGGGEQIVYVATEADSFNIGALPSWCNVKKYDKYFTVTCAENLSGDERADSFIVTAGRKSETIKISQSKEQAITLIVSKANINFSSIGGSSEPIFVNTNALNYSVLLIPSWCLVQIYKNYFVVTCNPNYSSKSRSDWFKIVAENQELKIYVTQTGSVTSPQLKTVNPPYVKKVASKYFFMNLGTSTNDIENLEKVMVTVGTRTFYIRIKFNPNMLGKGENYSTQFLANKLEITNEGRVKNFPSSSGYYYVVDDQMEIKRQSATLGTSFGGKKLRFYLGGGYGDRLNLWGLNLYSYSNNQNTVDVWAKNINQSWRGIEAESGVFIKLGHFNIMGGASTIIDPNQSTPFFEFHLGLGFSTR